MLKARFPTYELLEAENTSPPPSASEATKDAPIVVSRPWVTEWLVRISGDENTRMTRSFDMFRDMYIQSSNSGQGLSHLHTRSRGFSM